MKKVLFVTLLTTLLVAGLTATAPARTIYVPKTLAGSAARWSEGAVGFRFPATHVVFGWQGEEGSRILYRLTGAGGGPAGSWTEAPEAHDLEDHTTETHYSGVLSVPRALGVEVRPVETDEHTAEKIEVHYMNTADGPLEAHSVPATAEAAASTPRVIRRAEWGANESYKKTEGGCKRTFHPLQQLFVHHTAGSNGGNSYETMRATYYFHAVTRGWCDLGYNFVIGRDGTVFEGRWSRNYSPFETPTSEDGSGRATVGAHVSGYNSGSIGISLMGNFSEGQIPAKARSALVSTLAWIADRHNIDPVARKSYRNPDSGTTRILNSIAGHKDAGATACPGTNLYSDLPRIRKEVAESIGTGRQRVNLALSAAAGRVQYGQPAALAGRLTREDGTPLVAAPVKMWRKAGGRWKEAAGVVTDASGAFSYESGVVRNSSFAAVYAGDAATWEGSSAPRQIKVAPLVTLRPQGGKKDAGNVHRFPPGTARVRFEGGVTPDLTGRSLRVRIFRRNATSETLMVEKSASLKEGSVYLTGFKPRAAGEVYRIIVRHRAGNGYAMGDSRSVLFTVDPGP
jgi:hypothetical protein